MIWDDCNIYFIINFFIEKIKCVAELTFRTEIKAVKLKTDRMVVVIENRLFVYNFSDLRLLEFKESCPNPLGLCSINTEGEILILAYPDKNIGCVNIFNEKTK